MATSNNIAETGAPMQKIVRDITSFQRNLLIVLAEEPKYGLAIKRELEAYYAEDVNHGRLYPNLDDLAKMGLIEKSRLDKRTNQYELTDAGRKAVEDQFGWFVDHVAGEDTEVDVEALISTYC